MDSEGFPRSDIDIWTINEQRKKVIPLQNDHKQLMSEIEILLQNVFKPKAEPEIESNQTNEQNNDSIMDSNNNNDSNDGNGSNTDVKMENNELNGDETKDNNTGYQNPLHAIFGQSEIQNMVETIRNEVKILKQTGKLDTDMENPSNNNNNNNNGNNKPKVILKKKTPMKLKPFYLVDQIFEMSPAQECGLKFGDLIIQFGSMVYDNKSPKLLMNIVQSSINKPIPVIIKRNPEGIIPLQLIPKKWNGNGVLGCHLKPL